MKKRIIALCCAVLLALGLTQCEPRAPEEPDIPVMNEITPPAPAPQPKPKPQTKPRPQTKPVTPPMQLETGEPRLLNAMALETVVKDGNAFVTAEQLATAMHMTCTMDGDKAVLSGLSEATCFMADTCNAVVDGREVLLSTAPFFEQGTLYLPLDGCAHALACSTYTDDEAGVTYLTAGGGSWEIPPDVRVPIMEYHSITNDIWGIPSLFVDPANMEAQLAYLVDNGYDPIWFEDLRHVEQYDKPVLLTFDDGTKDNYLELFPLLKKYQVKATFFVVSGYVGNDCCMNADQLRDLAASGLVSIQSHGVTHHDMGAMDEETLRYEFTESKRVLAELTGAEPYAVSYPEGKVSELALRIAGEYFKFGTRREDRCYNTSEKPLLTARYNVARETTLDEFVAMLDEAAEA